MQDNQTINLVEYIEELEKIKATPENIERNKIIMDDNDGGIIEF